ncbi:hypothetical protein PV10_03887 [Exophiala mesophila]|uniref:Chromo domain-containing protein n=1 Tax=Exophiala mesophila TaxID=212818 RepID=A0A0D2A0M6_EXOME|nr:uncharacterized protein PV10_03887 [Exophiala mesophila]KIV92613.1 hypothetical protein PV10_03887 [Exophiala mesophila]
MTQESPASCEDEELFRVERILAERVEADEKIYLVKWAGYPDDQCTWEPKESFTELETITDWETQRNKGGLLDEEEVAAVQMRMDAFQARQEEAEAAEEEDQEAARLQASQSANTAESSSETPTTQAPRCSRSSKSPSPGSDLLLNTRKRKAHTNSPSAGDESPATKRPKYGETSNVASASTVLASQSAESQQSPVESHPATQELSTKEVHPPSQNPNPKSTKAVSPRTIASNSTNKSNHDIDGTQLNQQPSLPASRAHLPQPNNSVTPTTDHDASESISTPIAKPAATKATGSGQNPHSRAGQRFDSLRHRNNYMKRSRQEGVPDPTALDLRTPEEWSNGTAANNIGVGQSHDQHDGSTLFVPEESDHNTLELDVTNELDASIAKKSPVPTDVPGSDLQPLPNDTLDKHCTTTAERSTPDQLVPLSTLDGSTNNSDLPATYSTVAAKVHFENHSEVSPVQSSTLAPQQPQLARSTSQLQSFPVTRDTMTHAGNHETNSRGLVKTATGRFFDPREELLVQLYLGISPVGDVRIRFFPPWLKTKIKALKSSDGKLEIAFDEKCFQQPDEFAAFSKQLSPRAAAGGIIVAYEDTMKTMDSLIQHLEQYNVCAVWIYPDERETLVMILYSCGASGWKSFDHRSCSNADQHLHLSVRNSFYHLPHAPAHAVRRGSHNHSSLPYDQQDQPRSAAPPKDLDMRPARVRLDRTQTTPNLGSSSLGAANSAAQPTRRRSFTAEERPRLWSSKSHGGSIEAQQDLATGPNPVARREYDGPESAEFVGVPSTASRRRSSMANGESRESARAWAYQTLTKQDFDYMTTVAPAFRGDNSKLRVFITFTGTHPSEARIVQEWLRAYVRPRNLYSDALKTDWTEFLSCFENRSPSLSIVLFHSTLPDYIHYTKLGSFLKSDNFLCFSVDLELSPNSGPKCPLARLFPRGTVLCITEGCMTYCPKEVLCALEYFESVATPNWTLMLIPDITTWLTDRLAHCGEGEEKMISKMLELIFRLRSRLFTQNLLVDSNDFDRLAYLTDDEADALVLEVPRLSKYVSASEPSELGDEACLRARDKVVSEYFIGWTAMKASIYRCMILLDDKMTNKTEKLSGHVSIVDPVKFLNQFAVQQYPDKAREKA